MFIELASIFILSFTFFVVFANLSKVKFSWIEMISAILLMTFTSIIVFFYNLFVIAPTQIIIHITYMLVMGIITSRKMKIISLNAVYGITSSVIILLAGYTTGIAFDFIFGSVDTTLNISNLVDATLYLIAVSPLSLLISYLTGNYLHKSMRLFDEELKKRVAKYLLFGASVTLALFFIKAFLHDVLVEAELLNTVYGLTLAIYFSFLVIAIFSFTESFRKEAEIRHKDDMLKSLQSYTDSIENMATEVRKFRHDHMNLMLGFREYIDNNDIDNIRNYYQRYMSTFAENTVVLDSRLNILADIKIPEIKSILSFKFLYAQQLGITAHIEVPEIIEGISIYDLVDLCRVTGILLDNAIEACQELEDEEPILRFMALKKHSMVVFVFTNTCSSPPPLSGIFQKGFTTKKGLRGIGLHTVSQLLSENKRISLNTHIKDKMFIQELSIITE